MSKFLIASFLSKILEIRFVVNTGIMLCEGYFSLAIRDNQSTETNYYFSTATNPLTEIRNITSELCVGEVIVGGCDCLQLSASGGRRS